MKRKLHILSIIAVMLTIATVMVACKSSPKPDPANALVLSAVDTAGLAAFQSWKTQNERKDPNQYYMTGSQGAAVNNTATTARRTTTARQTNTVPVSQPAKKKGWSKAAKSAVIGGTAGAVAGAIINKKNRVLGGVIGGVLGGGIGYGIGRGMDKKDGRY